MKTAMKKLCFACEFTVRSLSRWQNKKLCCAHP